MMKVEHIGYLVKSIDKTALEFEQIGYKKGSVFNDDTQKTRICFLTKEDDVKIELVEPYEENETMVRLQKKMGVAPYHTCFFTDNIEFEYQKMLDNGYVPMFQPVAAIAFENRKICYFWKKSIGYIEIVEQYFK